MQFIRQLKPDVKKAIAPTIVATVIFFITYYCFGMENTMIGPFATLSFLRYRSLNNHYKCMTRNFVMYICMAVLAFIASMGLPAFIIINALVFFWIADIFIDEYNPTNYFPAGMAIIFFQIAPVADVQGLLRRIMALLATFVIVFLFVFVLSKKDEKPDLVPQLIQKGFDNCKKQLMLCEREDASEEELSRLRRELRELNKQCSHEIYSYNRASIRPRGFTNWYCHYLLVFQSFNFHSRKHRDPSHLEEALNLYSRFLHEFETARPPRDDKRLTFRIRKPDIRNFRLRFALRLIIILIPCLIFAKVSGMQNAYWLVISVFFMMIPFSDGTAARVRQRVFGTMGGILLCLGLFYLFRSFPARVIIMTIANFLIYGANGYGPTVVYITCSALSLQTLEATISLVLLQRLIYTGIGAAIALLANRYLFPIRNWRQMHYLADLLSDLRAEMKEIVLSTKPGDSDRRKELDARIVKSYLLSKRLEVLSKTAPDPAKAPDFEALEKEHMLFIGTYLSRYLTEESTES